MAGRIRSIKPEINENKRTAALSSDAWRLFVSLWLQADDYGNLYADPERLLAAVFWAVKKKPKIEDVLAELTEAPPLLELYEHKGQRYAHVTGWDHQKIDHPGLPRVPGPDPEETERIRERIQDLNRQRVAKRAGKSPEVLASTDRALTEHPQIISRGARSRSDTEIGDREVPDPGLGSSPPPPDRLPDPAAVVGSTAREAGAVPVGPRALAPAAVGQLRARGGPRIAWGKTLASPGGIPDHDIRALMRHLEEHQATAEDVELVCDWLREGKGWYFRGGGSLERPGSVTIQELSRAFGEALGAARAWHEGGRKTPDRRGAPRPERRSLTDPESEAQLRELLGGSENP